MKKPYKFSSMLLACVAFTFISFQSIGQSVIYENYKGIENLDKAKAEYAKDKHAFSAENTRMLRSTTSRVNKANNSSPEDIPINDNCANATPAVCGTTVSGSTVGAATLSSNSISGCGTSVNSDGTNSGSAWYAVIGDGLPITLSTCNAGTNYDTWITVYTGSCGALSCHAWNDDVGCSGFRSGLTMPTTLGQTYYIVVSGWSTSEGAFELSIAGSCSGSPCVPINNTFTASKPNALFQSAGANQANTYYWGLSYTMYLTANPTGGVAPYTYAWYSNSGYTIKNATSKRADLFYPTGAGWVNVDITDANNCTVKDSIFIDWVDFTCNQPNIWYYQLCDNITNTTSCVAGTWNMIGLLNSGNYSFGSCTPKADFAKVNDGLKVYPNPSNGAINISMPIANASSGSINILDMNGRVLYSESVELNEGLFEHYLNVSDFANGVYSVQLISENEIVTERVVIQH